MLGKHSALAIVSYKYIKKNCFCYFKVLLIQQNEENSSLPWSPPYSLISSSTHTPAPQTSKVLPSRALTRCAPDSCQMC